MNSAVMNMKRMLNEEENVNLKIKEGVLVIKDIFNTGPGVI